MMWSSAEKIWRNPRTRLKVIKEFGKVSTQNSMEFLHNGREQSENDLKKIIPLAVASERMKYSEINLAEVPDSCTESYKTES